MERNKIPFNRLGKGELFVHDLTDLEDYDTFFEFVIANGEMTGRVDALHSQHVRGGAKKDVLCVRPVDLWGERTYPVTRGRPGGRFISTLTKGTSQVGVSDLCEYSQRLDPQNATLTTAYRWQKEECDGQNISMGFMSKTRKHVMLHRYVDSAAVAGWTRLFSLETIFPYHSRATTFYFKKPYNSKSWAWGETEAQSEVEAFNNAMVSYDQTRGLATINFATSGTILATRVVWAVKPSVKPDRFNIDPNTGAINFYWDLSPGKQHDITIFMSLMTDRDCGDFISRAETEALEAAALGWEALKAENDAWWREELALSSVKIPDSCFQTLYDASMYYLLTNVGGSYWGWCGIDNVIYDICMCDNLVFLQGLIETGHLKIAADELKLFDRMMDDCRFNAAERMRVTYRRKNDDAMALPFYMGEDGIDLWKSFGMYVSSTSVFHSMNLFKTALYSGDREFLEKHAYPWLRGYAEYGRSNVEWDEDLGAYIVPLLNFGGGGEGEWYMHTMNQKIYFKSFANTKPLFRYSDLPKIEDFPYKDISAMEQIWLDSAVNYKWIMSVTAELAGSLGLDHDLAPQWRKISENIYIPQNDRVFIAKGRPGTDATKNAKGSTGRPHTGGLFWPAEGFFEQTDQKKLARTYRDFCTQRTIYGFKENISWDGINAFNYIYMGDGEAAWHTLQAFEASFDKRGIEIREGKSQQNYYFMLGHSTLVLLIRYMLLLSYNDKIRIFPAIPEDWREAGVSFDHMPVQHGLTVSAHIDLSGYVATIFDTRGKAFITMRSAGRPGVIRLIQADAGSVCALLEPDANLTVTDHRADEEIKLDRGDCKTFICE